MLIKDLPQDLRELATLRAGKGVVLEATVRGSFHWHITPEGDLFWGLVDQGLFSEARESLLGRSIKGFKFDESSTELIYNSEMDEYIGKVGRVVYINEGMITIAFEDDVNWSYPIVLALNHLLPKGSVDQYTEELHRTSPDGKSEGIRENPLTPEDVEKPVEAGEKQRVFETGSKRDDSSNKPRVADLKAYTRLRFGWHMLLGAKKYGEGNFELGQPDKSTLESMHRHLAMYELGDRSEDHLSALLFGIQLLMQNEQREGIEPDHFYKLNK